ncbi:LCP family protein [Streptomyces sp. NBC_01387]|uniref:LCP family protein n=1 Tax=unclassified Streptomyces TaxID=2593676 RepID=UPI0020251AA7|nr:MULTISPECIES: LCP family protein [unclassified Streptomyces]MCX4550706.1 LCP family protein [Streptomyces sp. NBC_01500]WSV55992.1 LCP family protein [Streptomyces sp. NBC_01014]
MDDRDRYGRGSENAQPEGARVMRHVQRSAPAQRQYGQQSQGRTYEEGYDSSYDSGYNTGQVYGQGGPGNQRGPGGPGPGGPRTGARPGRAPNWGRRIRVGVLVLVVVVLATSIGTYFWADGKLRREVDLSKVIDRPATGKGTNYLIVGSDSREGMSAADKKKLHTGSAEGKRTDSMIILHVGDHGNTMISLPRDSNVTVPSYKGSQSGKLYPNTGRQEKLNAAYAEDGPELLVRTIEYNTGLHIDHYAEIGFDGFAKIVDAVGGVDMNLPKGFKDKYSGADFKAGEQTLNGQQALAFVRTRHAFAASDLERTKNQQKFLAALASQTATPTTVMNPFKLYPVMGAGLDTVIVDKDMSLWNLASMFWAMKGVSGGDGKQMNMPISGSTGGNLVWDKTKVKELVQQLKDDDTVTVTGN